jgi:hypothetical protein
MGTSASSPPGDGQGPNGEDEELELTSIMDAEQRRALQKAARKLETKESEPEEQQRPTARPPPEADAAARSERDVAMPKPQRVPAEAREAATDDAASNATPAATPAPPARSNTLFSLVAFVLLAGAVAYELTR